MNYFYVDKIEEPSITLNESDSKHCVQVLRKKVGDQIAVLDGKGKLFYADITKADKKACRASIIEIKEFSRNRDYTLHIAIAPTKNINRFEWFLEKACELGIDEITPIICHNSERKNLREERLNKILISAMKQSGNKFLPRLNPIRKWGDFLMRSKNDNGTKLIAYVREKSNTITKNYKASDDVTIIIGPEGGFTEAEIEEANRHGYKEVSLGGSRLRTETAGIFACSVIKTINLTT